MPSKLFLYYIIGTIQTSHSRVVFGNSTVIWSSLKKEKAVKHRKKKIEYIESMTIERAVNYEPQSKIMSRSLN